MLHDEDEIPFDFQENKCILENPNKLHSTLYSTKKYGEIYFAEENENFFILCTSCVESFLDFENFAAHTKHQHMRLLNCREKINPLNSENDDSIQMSLVDDDSANIRNSTKHENHIVDTETGLSHEAGSSSLQPSNSTLNIEIIKALKQESSDEESNPLNSENDDLTQMSLVDDDSANIRNSIKTKSNNIENMETDLSHEAETSSLQPSCSTLHIEIIKAFKHESSDEGSNPLNSENDEPTQMSVADNDQANVRIAVKTKSSCNENSGVKKSNVKKARSTEPRAPKYQCEICSQTFKFRKSFTAHKKYDHLPDPFALKEPDPMSSDDNLESVQQTKERTSSSSKVVQPVDVLQCKYCGKKFVNRSRRMEHEDIHTGVKPFKCQFCEKGFLRRTQCKRHESRHLGIKPHKCEICGAAYVDKVNLNVHIRRHKGDKIFKCSYCDKSFVQNMEKKLHEFVHTGEKPFLCIICGARFTNSSHLTTHNRTCHNNGENLHKCEVCGKTFVRKISYNEHKNVHTGERPHACNVCPAKYTARKTLLRHILKHHPDVSVHSRSNYTLMEKYNIQNTMKNSENLNEQNNELA